MSEILGSKYVLENEIGRGGMGIVWVAYDLQLRRRVAVKVMAPERVAAPSAKARFEHEATAIARLRNPHVVQIHDYGIDGDAPFIVMELLEGQDLESLAQQKRMFSFDETLNVVRQAGKGLGAAHAAGLVHCDLKPANLFLARGDEEEVVKILDFGLVTALLQPDVPAVEGGLGGTPTYMSPEHIRGSTVDHRSDLWSLGVVAYRMLTGRLPFLGASFVELAMKICGFFFDPPSEVAQGSPPGVDAFFERALAKDPAQRFQSAREMVAAFTALGKHGPARPIKILVADDEPEMSDLIRQSFRRKIRSSAYSFIFASDGASALDELRRHPDVDIVLTDINMPGMDGLTLLSRIAETSPTARALVLTAYGDMKNIRTAMNRGAFDFLVKPVDFEDLEATIDKTFRHVEEGRRGAHSSEENEVLRMFVSPSLVTRIKSLGAREAAGSDTFDAAVAIMNVHGFSALSRRLPPSEAVGALNANFDVIVPEIAARGGCVERFVGDAAVAVFIDRDHVERALDACLAVRSQLEDLARRAGDGSPYACGVSAGVAAGQVTVAGLGSRAFRRLDYALVGDVVATAASLSSLAGRGQILVDASVYEVASRALSLEPAGSGRVAAAGEPTPLYNVTGRLRAPPDAQSMSTTAMLCSNAGEHVG